MMDHVFETECIMSLQGHSRSLILAPIQNAHGAAVPMQQWASKC